MGATKELFIKLRDQEIQDEFLDNHIIFCTLKPTEAVTTAPYDNK